MVAVSVAFTWGTDEAERRGRYPCDGLVTAVEGEYYRGITVRAGAGTLFRWLCQLRAAPYSYDWIDNGGRPSPRELTPGLEALAVGQAVMRIFRLEDFEVPRHLTLTLSAATPAGRAFGALAVSYVVAPVAGGRCRLLVKLAVRYPRGVRGSVMRRLLPWGDLVMMRRQLLNLKRLAEASANGRP
jgi:hypothetical protein